MGNLIPLSRSPCFLIGSCRCSFGRFSTKVSIIESFLHRFEKRTFDLFHDSYDRTMIVRHRNSNFRPSINNLRRPYHLVRFSVAMIPASVKHCKVNALCMPFLQTTSGALDLHFALRRLCRNFLCSYNTCESKTLHIECFQHAM